MSSVRRIPIVASVVLFAGGTVVGPRQAIGAGAARCRPGHPYLVEANDRAQVFTTPPRGEARPQVFACAYGRHPSFHLGADAEGGGSEYSLLAPHASVGRYRLAGTIVAYETSAPYPTGEDLRGARWMVVVRDLLSGRVLHRSPTGPSPPSKEYVGSGETGKILVKEDGAVAWAVDNFERQAALGTGWWEIHVDDRSGRRLVAAGKDIDYQTLTLIGSTLFWTQGAHVRTAHLH